MAAARPILRNGEGLRDQEPEVVWDFRCVGQLQVVGGHQLTQHLGGHRGWRWGAGCICTLLARGSGGGTQIVAQRPRGTLRSRYVGSGGTAHSPQKRAAQG